MFYFKEIILRLKYYLISCAFLICLLVYYKHLLLVLISFSLLNKNLLIKASSLILIHPIELFKIHCSLIIFFLLIFAIPILTLQMQDFLKSSLYRNESKALHYLAISIPVLFNAVQITLLTFVLPSIWCFFEQFQKSLETVEVLNFFFQPRLEDYFTFLLNFICITSIFFCFVLFCIIFIYFLKLKTFIYWQKTFVALNILISTLCSSPDIFNQIVFLTILSCFFELIKISRIYSYELSLKNVKNNSL